MQKTMHRNHALTDMALGPRKSERELSQRVGLGKRRRRGGGLGEGSL
jgi:hypothetical protein